MKTTIKLMFLLVITSVSLVTSTKSIHASNVSNYQYQLTSIMENTDNDGDEDYYHVKFDKTTSNLYITIKLPDRKAIYGGDFYWYEAVHAVKLSKLNNVNTITIKDSDDKYTFNLQDIENLNLSKKFIKSWGQQNNPSDYDDAEDQDNYDILRYDYVFDTLTPKAINHISYDENNN